MWELERLYASRLSSRGSNVGGLVNRRVSVEHLFPVGVLSCMRVLVRLSLKLAPVSRACGMAEIILFPCCTTLVISSFAKFDTTVPGQRYSDQAGETRQASLEACTNSPSQLCQRPLGSKSIQYGIQQ